VQPAANPFPNTVAGAGMVEPETENISVGTPLPGIVVEVLVKVGQRMKAGDPLFRIDDRPFRIAAEEAEARLADARLQIEALKATYHQKVADLRAAQSALDYQQGEYERQKRLSASGISSQAQVERALMVRNESEQKVAAAQQEITSTLASLGGDPSIPVDRHPTVQQAQARLDRAKLDLSYTRIYAPIDGRIDRNFVDVGNLVGSGQATLLASIVRDDPIYVYFTVSERELLQYREQQRQNRAAEETAPQLRRLLGGRIGPAARGR